MCDRSELIPIPPLLWDADAIGAFDATSAEYGVNDHGERCLNVDACIVPALRALWAAGVVTEGCCCGHGSGGGVISIQADRVEGVDPRSTGVFMRQSVFEMHLAQVRAQALEECAEMLLEHSGSDVLQWINAQLRGAKEPDHD